MAFMEGAKRGVGHNNTIVFGALWLQTNCWTLWMMQGDDTCWCCVISDTVKKKKLQMNTLRNCYRNALWMVSGIYTFESCLYTQMLKYSWKKWMVSSTGSLTKYQTLLFYASSIHLEILSLGWHLFFIK